MEKSLILNRKCRVCKETFPLTEEYFHKWKYDKDGFRHECKKCRVTRSKQPLTPPGMKFCYKCNRMLPATREYFHLHPKKPKGVYYICKDCRKRIEKGKDYLKVLEKKNELKAMLLREQDGKCYYCGSTLEKIHIEHKTPKSRGGTDEIENLCLSCPDCNLSKWARTVDEYKEYKRRAINVMLP